jgi:hypothetical protein
VYTSSIAEANGKVDINGRTNMQNNYMDKGNFGRECEHMVYLLYAEIHCVKDFNLIIITWFLAKVLSL